MAGVDLLPSSTKIEGMSLDESDVIDHPSRGALLSYDRDFLLSLREKEICKKLPIGIDLSLLSEIEEVASHPHEWQRGAGGSSLHGSRRGEFAPSSYPRGSSSRWDKDGRSVADHDYGRRIAGQHRRFGHKPEQDGLLGSGVFPRSSEPHQVWTSTSKDRGDGHHQLNRTNEPYQPPRTQKSGLYSRKDVTDSYNDETFGSSECSDQKRQEEERLRRESFEMMRKEQRMLLQGMKKNVKGKHTENDINSVLDGCPIDPILDNRDEEKLERNAALVSESECPKLSSTGSNAPQRPLVPPGFSSTTAETSTSKQLNSSSLLSSVENLGNNGSCHSANNIPAVSGQEYAQMKAAVIDLNDHKSFSDHLNSVESLTCSAAVPSLERDSILGHDSTKIKTTVALDISGQVASTSIMEKLLGLGMEDGGTQDPESSASDEALWSTSFSTKLDSWFLEHPAKPPGAFEDSSRDILSMIVGTEKEESGSAGFSVGNLPDSVGISEANLGSSALPENLYDAPVVGSSMLTCEDLEQSILAEVRGTNSVDTCKVGPNGDSLKADVDNEASEHLLTLLQKGPTKSKEDYIASEENKCADSALGSVFGTNPEESGKPLTLEALFGSAFMQELHSMDVPISSLRPKVDVPLSGDAAITTEFPIELNHPLNDKSFISQSGNGLNCPPKEVDDVTKHRMESLTFPSMDQSKRLSSSSPLRVPLPDVSHQHLHGQPVPSLLPFLHSKHEMTSAFPRQLEHSTSHQHDPLHQFLANPSLHLQQRFDQRFHHHMPPHPMPMAMPMAMPRGFAPAPHPLQYFPRGGPLPHAVASSHPDAMHHALQAHHNQMAYGMQMPGMAAMDPSTREMVVDPHLRQYHHHNHPHHHQFTSRGAHLSGVGQARFFNPELSSGPRNSRTGSLY